ncbi:MAG TPA: HAD family hydrolase, partial [Thiotrichaceae bacterium]|nr:HAD family hydrolase [Thiotrichaceae bacterium]
MQKPIVYALDFDGVICDSVIEITFAAWKAAQSLW